VVGDLARRRDQDAFRQRGLAVELEVQLVVGRLLRREYGDRGEGRLGRGAAGGEGGYQGEEERRAFDLALVG